VHKWCVFLYLDHLDAPWDDVYKAELLEGKNDTSIQELVIGGEVCMWAETADASVVHRTIWPRAAAGTPIVKCVIVKSDVKKMKSTMEFFNIFSGTSD